MKANYDPNADTLSFVLKEGVAVTDAKKMEFQVAWRCERYVARAMGPSPR